MSAIRSWCILINRVKNWVCALLHPSNGSAPQVKQHIFVLQKVFFFSLIWLRFFEVEMCS